MPDLNWDQLPTFEWSDLYTQVAWGLDDPEWRSWSKKSRNQAKRKMVADAEKEIRAYVGFAWGLWSMGLSTSGPPALAGVLVSFFVASPLGGDQYLAPGQSKCAA